jgi:Cdc6-like AAA superfamily ATPase
VALRPFVALWLLGAVACAGTAGADRQTGGSSLAMAAPRAARAGELASGSDRVAIKSARLELEVAEVAPAAREATEIARGTGGYVEDTRTEGERSARLVLRVPAEGLETSLDRLAQLGDEKARSISTQDVTDVYRDIETRLASARQLRERLQALLARASTVKDLLAVETELGRVQSDIESMQGQLDRMKGHVDLASVSLVLEQRRVPGPLGYVALGIRWVVVKLFWIR